VAGGLSQRKIPMTPPEIETVAFWYVGLCLNQLHHHTPQYHNGFSFNFYDLGNLSHWISFPSISSGSDPVAALIHLNQYNSTALQLSAIITYCS
jgi:hypothetical protein